MVLPYTLCRAAALIVAHGVVLCRSALHAVGAQVAALNHTVTALAATGSQLNVHVKEAAAWMARLGGAKEMEDQQARRGGAVGGWNNRME